MMRFSHRGLIAPAADLPVASSAAETLTRGLITPRLTYPPPDRPRG